MRRLLLHILSRLLRLPRQFHALFFGAPPPPTVVLGEPEEAAPAGLLVYLPFGDAPAPPRPDALALDVQDLGRLTEILRFARRRTLPVAAWVIGDLHRLPTTTRRRAALVARLAAAAGGTTIVVDTRGMPTGDQRRLAGHLTRMGCKAGRDTLSKSRRERRRAGTPTDHERPRCASRRSPARPATTSSTSSPTTRG